MQQVLIIGGSGNVGRALTRELSWSGDVAVRPASRNPTGLVAKDGVDPVRFDYDDPTTFGPALEGVDSVFMIGPPSPEPHVVMLPFLEQAARENRKIVLMTALGADADEGGSLRRVETALEGSGSPYVILRPNWFMDNFHTMWLSPIQQGGVIPLPAADSRTSLIDSRDIAASAAAALRVDRFDGRSFNLTGPEALTYSEAAAVLSEAAGRPIRYESVDDESFVRSLSDAGVPADLSRYLAVLFGFARQGAAAPVSPSVEEITGRAATTLRAYAKEHASAWAA